MRLWPCHGVREGVQFTVPLPANSSCDDEVTLCIVWFFVPQRAFYSLVGAHVLHGVRSQTQIIDLNVRSWNDVLLYDNIWYAAMIPLSLIGSYLGSVG